MLLMTKAIPGRSSVEGSREDDVIPDEWSREDDVIPSRASPKGSGSIHCTSWSTWKEGRGCMGMTLLS